MNLNNFKKLFFIKSKREIFYFIIKLYYTYAIPIMISRFHARNFHEHQQMADLFSLPFGQPCPILYSKLTENKMEIFKLSSIQCFAE